jgi:hypothetical protein
MASYGFGDYNEGWKESKKDTLAEELMELVEDIEREGKFIGLKQGQRPYVQVDEPYRGVAIMNIAFLKKEYQNELIERADKRYLTVMTAAKDSVGYTMSKNIEPDLSWL